MSALGVGTHQPATVVQAESSHDPSAQTNALENRPNNRDNISTSSSASTKTANEKEIGGYEDIHIAHSRGHHDAQAIDPEGEEQVVKLARQMSAMSAVTSSSVGTTVHNPFTDPSDPALDPNNDKFNVRKWLKTLLHITSRDPETYPTRTAGLSYRDLNVHGFGKPTDFQKDVGNIFISGFQAVKGLLGMGSKQKIQILRNFDGLIKSGEMLVVLGRPGSGCSTLLKTIAGETYGFHIDESSYLNYQGIPRKMMQNDFRGEVIYQAETDVHFPHLTVAETLSFAAQARAPRNRMPGVSRKQYAEHMRDAVMAIFGLSHTFNTKVGNDFIRGVSGGERKRVSIAEVTLSFAPLQCWDNSTRGLDSATALEFVRTLRMSTELGGSTAVVAIYQASQAAYDVFDKVVVLYEGRQIYFGPTEAAKAYFLDMGFICPDRQTTADFLTSLTNAAERVIKPGYENRVPRTPDEFALRWKESEARKQLLQEIEEFDREFPVGGDQVAKFREARQAQQAKRMSVNSPYTISIPMQVKLCMTRGFQRLKNDMSMMFTTIFGNLIMALIVGSVFYNLPDTSDSFYSRGALLFFAILLNAFSSALEILTLYAQRPIVEKHAKYALYHPFSEAISSMLVDMPSKIVVAITFNLVLYFLTNLRRTVDAFFVFLLFSFVCTLTMSMIFRTIASFSRTLQQAMPPAAIFMLALVIYTGFTIPTRDMVVWFRWINYINPIGYAFESLLVNEFHNRDFPCGTFVPSGPGYESVLADERICSTTGAKAGLSYVNGDDYIETAFSYRKSHEWRNLGVIFGFMFFFLGTYIFGTELISAAKSKGEVLMFRRGGMPAHMKSKASDEEVPLEKAKITEDGTPNINDTSAVIQRQTAIFHWQDVVYDIKIKGKDRRLLDHVDGWVKPGTLTALMGVSGAGKTTLLDVLANRVTMGIVTGNMMVDGRQRDDSFQRKTGYVQQQDLHLETSTVREALIFSARLRQPKHVPDAEKVAYASEVIKLLEMEEYADAIVGVPGEGLNVEQRKRLTIGTELSAKPDLLLFLDEPTSGLDSQTAWSICALMRKLAQNGQAILCTIHQPSAILFQAFDRLLFLQRGGQTVYFGEIGQNSEILTSYFERNGGPPCPPDANPAEWMLEVIGAAPGAHTDKNWFEVWSNSPEKVVVREELARLERELVQKERVDNGTGNSEFAASSITQVLVCTKRVFEQYWRTPSYIYAKLFLCLATALFIGFSFYMAGTSIQGLQNQMFSVFMLLTVHNNLSQQMMPHFVTQRALYEVRERPSKAYSWVSFMSANIIVEIPWQTLMAVVSFVSYYYPIGLYKNAQATDTLNERSALMFLLILAFYIWTSTFTHMVIAGIETAETGGNIGQLLFSLSLIFCGVLAGPSVLPGFWIFMYRVSPFTYLVGGMLGAGLGGNKVECSSIEVLHFEPAANKTCGEYLAAYQSVAGGTVLNSDATSDCQFCSIADTNVFLQSVSVNYADRWRDFGLIIVYIAVNISMAYFFYWLARVPKKWGKKVETK